MKKLLILTALFLLTSSGLKAQQTIQIGTGTTAANYLIHNGWFRTYTQTIYTADLLPPVMNISEIAYEYVGVDDRPKRIKIWFSATTENDIGGQFVKTEYNKQLVFEGVINRTPPADGEESVWLPIVLQTPYFYSGDNLLITTSVTDNNWLTVSNFRVSPSSAGTGVTSYWFDDGDINNFLENPSGVKASFTNFLNIKFTHQAIEEPFLSINPKGLDFSEHLTNTTKNLSVTLSNVGAGTLTITGVDISDLDIFSCDANFPIVLNEGVSQQVNFSFTPEVQKDYSATVEFIVLEEEYYGYNTIPLSGTGIDFIPSEINCFGTPWNPGGTGPLSASHRYSAVQYSLTKEEIGTDTESRIRRIGFNADGPCIGPNVIAIYLQNTATPHTYPWLAGNATFINASGMTKVYEGPYEFTEAGWNYIDIEPYLYDGTSHLLVTTVQLESPAVAANRTNFYISEKTGLAFDRRALMLIASGDFPIDVYDLPPYISTAQPYSTSVNNFLPNICFVFEDIPQQPNIYANKRVLDYDEQEMDVVFTMPVRIKNTGRDNMVITNIAFTSEDFYVTDVTFPIVIPYLEEQTINFAVTPLQLRHKKGKATFEFETPTLGNPYIDLSVYGLRFNALREGFESEIFPPVGWKIIDANNDGHTWKRYIHPQTPDRPYPFMLPPHEGRCVASPDHFAGTPGQPSTTFDDWFITPKMRYETGDTFSFYVGGGMELNRLYIRLSKTGNNINDFNQTIDYITHKVHEHYRFEYALADFGLKSGDEFHIAFHDLSFWGSNRYSHIDKIRGSTKVALDHDLMVQDCKVSGTIINASAETTYSAMVANAGLITVTGNEYSVELCRYDNQNNVVVLASKPGQSLKKGDSYTATFSYAFADPGKYRIFVRVVYAQDENMINNTSNTLSVDVFPPTVEFITSGSFSGSDQHEVVRMVMTPIAFAGMGLLGSLCQTYYPTEHFKGVAGTIDRFSYYYNCSYSRPNKDIRVWMSNTTLSPFESGLIPNASDMELVFDGKLTFPRTENPYQELVIELHKPFTYIGEYVVLMIEWQGGTGIEGGPTGSFATNTGWVMRTYYKQTQIFDVNNVAGSGLSPWPFSPITSFYIDKATGMGTLKGSVVYGESGNPATGARVAITSATYPKMNAVVRTDAAGNFNFPKIFAANDLKITVSKFGYLDAVVENVNLSIGGTVTLPQPIQLSPRPRVTVSGRVMTSDRQEPLSNATVKLFGMEDFTATSGADGVFTFNDVWTNSPYTLEIEHDDYQKFTSAVLQVENDNPTSLGDFTVLQIAHRANAIRATQLADQSVELNWFAPLAEFEKVFRRDDGSIVATLIVTDPTPQVAVGPAFHENGIIKKVMWYQPFYTDVVVTDTFNIHIFGLHPNGTPNYQDILGSYQRIGTRPNQWNEFVLPTPVTATNGFMVGLAAANRSTMTFIYDNGNHPDWRWQPNTMWAVFDFLGGPEPSAFPIEQLTSMHANLLIRAEGIWTGDFVPKGNVPALANVLEETTTEKPRMLTMSMPELTEGYLTEMPQEPLRMLETVLRTNRLPATSSEWLAENQRLIDEINERKGVLQYAPTGSPHKSTTPLPPIGYNIYRADLSTSSTFVRLNTAGPITTTTFIDPEYATLGRGRYQYAVTALYVGGVESARSLSNILDKDVFVSGSINVSHNATGHNSTVLGGAYLSLQHNTTGQRYDGVFAANTNGVITFADVYRGIYTLTINAAGFETYIDRVLDFTTSETVYNVNVELKEIIVKPYWLSVSPNESDIKIGSTANFSWNPPPFFDGAEAHQDFAVDNIENWMMIDLDKYNTGHILNHNWTNYGAPHAFMIFNPYMTTPRLTDFPGLDFSPYEGNKYFLAWCSYGYTVYEDNWMISKELDFDMPFEFSFYAKGLRGTEEFKIAYSLGTDNWKQFITIGVTRRVNSSNWQKITTTLPPEAKRVAIQHFNSDLGLMIDNISIGIPAQETRTFKHYEVYLDDRFMGETTDVNFEFTELRNGIRTAGVVAVYSSGKSEMSTIEFEVTGGLENKFYVDVLEMENGTIVVKDPAGAEIPEGTLIDGGTQITITAVPEYGYRPLLVTVDGTPFVSGQSIAITKDLLVTATFEVRTYSITFDPNGGTGTMAPQGFTYGIPQNLTANAFTPPTDMYFIGWAYTATGDIVYSNQAEYFATDNKTLFAIWDDNPVVVCTITLSANPTIGGTVSGGGNHNQGLQATVRATANSGYRFVNWTEGTTEVSTEANYTFTVTEDRTLVANFVQFFRVNITQPANGTVSVKAAGVDVNHGDELDHGTVLTLLATPAENYEFVRWAHDNHNQPMHSHTLTNHVTISAVFRLKSSIQTTEKEILTIYPNPVKDELNIQTEQVIRQIFVFDLTGKVVMQLQGNHRTINMQTLPIGNYIIRIHTENAIIPVRIVKQ